MNIEKIVQLIEELREEIHKLHEKEGSINEDVLKKSQELDKLLNKYYKLLHKK